MISESPGVFARLQLQMEAALSLSGRHQVQLRIPSEKKEQVISHMSPPERAAHAPLLQAWNCLRGPIQLALVCPSSRTS